MSADPLRVGLIGYGLAGRSFHAPLVAATPGLRLAAVVTRDAERRAQAAREHPAAALVGTADALWALGDRLDVVVIAAPNRAHVPLATAALEAGLAVVVDKPLAATAADGRRLLEAARRHGRLLTVFQNRRWDGDFLTVRRLVADGALGAVHRFESRFERWRPVPKPGWRERAAPEEAGGVLYDLGSHLVDQALCLFGPVARVYAELDRRRPGAAVEDDAFVALEHASGVRSHLWMSAVAAQPGPRFRVLGSRAAYVKHGLDGQEARLRAGERPPAPAAAGAGAPADDWGVEPRERWGTLGAEGAVAPVETARGDWRRFYAGLVAALRAGAPPPVDPADAVAGLAVLEAARRSAAGGGAVSLPTV
ncbi:MAG TPA: Gfo/Idh/MocA family oxidoreductase [Gemmatimonadales bacterium]|nr:Gfo/Idh/MocA family oxidoreductase [Gemmatimonadales bacterium]